MLAMLGGGRWIYAAMGGSGVFTSITSSSMVAQYLILGCLVVIVTTMALRVLEYAIYRMKI